MGGSVLKTVLAALAVISLSLPEAHVECVKGEFIVYTKA